VAVWSEFTTTTSFDEIYARVLNADGSFAGPAFQADGSFVVAWANILAGQTERDIVVRRFDADGTPLGDQVVVNTTTEGYQMLPSVTAFADGRFFIAWRDSETAGDDIRGRLFAADGIPTGPDFAVSTTPNNSQVDPETVLLTSGKIAVVWYATAEVTGRILNPDGTWATAEFTIGDGNISGTEDRLGIDALDGGGFVVTWSRTVDRWTPTSSSGLSTDRARRSARRCRPTRRPRAGRWTRESPSARTARYWWSGRPTICRARSRITSTRTL
jgi:hypothetical protein